MKDQQSISNLIAEFLKESPASLDRSLSLSQLVTDSFLLVELVIYLQEETDTFVQRKDFEAVKTVGDLIDVIQTPASGSGSIIRSTQAATSGAVRFNSPEAGSR